MGGLGGVESMRTVAGEMGQGRTRRLTVACDRFTGFNLDFLSDFFFFFFPSRGAGCIQRTLVRWAQIENKVVRQYLRRDSDSVSGSNVFVHGVRLETPSVKGSRHFCRRV